MEYLLALQHITYFYPAHAAAMLRQAGNAAEVYARRDALCRDMELPAGLMRQITGPWDEHLEWARREIEWCRKKHIDILGYGSAAYPQRLMDCADAPLVLFYRGTVTLNAPHVVSIVGTRDATPYGNDMVNSLVSGLKSLVPDTLVVSGLAYGIDVMAHRASLASGVDTVGVLAHGLDTIYPAVHRGVACEMAACGGLLTEYPSGTRGDRQHFLQRNRIVAGMADCVVVVESKVRGGSLVTARLAGEYGHEVVAFPGRVGDEHSAGCNRIIREGRASLVTSAQDLCTIMGWHTVQEVQERRAQGIQPSLFTELTADEQRIVDMLRDGDKQNNVMAASLQMPISRLSAMLFDMEMRGIVKPLAGGIFHLIAGK